MKIGIKEILISTMAVTLISAPVYAESLFRTGVSKNVYPSQPRSLFSSMKAKTIGDLVTIIVDQNTDISDQMNFSSANSSSITDNFTTILEDILPGKGVFHNIDGYGGDNSVGNSASVTRTATFSDTITAQVIQILPNGNLVVQGKKVSVNNGEKFDLVVSGIVDPRLIDNTGSIESNLIANFQIAILGDGSISRAENEGKMNKFFKLFF